MTCNETSLRLLCLILFSLMIANYVWLNGSNNFLNLVSYTEVRNVPTQDSSVQPACKTPKTHVVFIKTHKCASSTIQNVFFRYGEKHNLTFGFPRRRILNYYQNPPGKFNGNSSLDITVQRERINFMCFHGRPDFKKLRKSMPLDAETIFVTILREPISMFESMYQYRRAYHRQFNGGRTLETFLQTEALFKVIDSTSIGNFVIQRKFENGSSQNLIKRLEYISLWNPMLFDLGIEYKKMINASENQIKEILRELENEFNLVLLVERFDESLMLLKELLCWEWEDMIYMKINTRDSKKIQKRNNVLSNPTFRDILARWNYADLLLYNHFQDKFNQKVALYGHDRMKTDVAKLELLRKRVENACGFAEESLTTKREHQRPIESTEINQSQARFFEKFNGTSACNTLTRAEPDYIRLLWKLHDKKLKKKYGNQTIIRHRRQTNDILLQNKTY